MTTRSWAYCNDGAPTRLAPDGSPSSPDVTLCHPGIATKITWRVGPTLGSDHLPIVFDLELRYPLLPSRRPPPKFSFGKADWELFRLRAHQEFAAWDAASFPSLDKAEKDFTRRMTRASSCIPRGSLPRPKGWWTERCSAARRKVRAALGHLRHHRGEPEAQQTYAEARQRATGVYEEEKAKAWQSFASTLHSKVPASRVWNVIRAIDGRARAPLPDSSLEHDGKKAFTDEEKAALATKIFAGVSSVRIPRLATRDAYTAVRDHLRIQPGQDQRASPFSAQELRFVLSSPGGKASGPDGIPPRPLRELPPAAETSLLTLLNRSWMEARLPARWKRADVVPILKKGKPPTAVKSYRPVSLLSCVGKLVPCGRPALHLGRGQQHHPTVPGRIPQGQSNNGLHRANRAAGIRRAADQEDDPDSSHSHRLPGGL